MALPSSTKNETQLSHAATSVVPRPTLPNDPPRAAYVHVPFCRHRCGYCNFTLVAGRDDLIDAYLAALQIELAAVPRGTEIDTLYLGGGTPTHLPAPALSRLLKMLRSTFTLASENEFTVEANPLDLDAARCDVLRDFTVNRISLGVQSFNDAKLLRLERDHRSSDIVPTIARAFAVATSVSIDLIFAAPHETIADWQTDLELATATGVQHLSLYGLTYERGAAFYGRQLRGDLQALPEESEAVMYELAIDCAQAAGFEHYEVSNFARAHHASRHNTTYWQGRSYYAFGPGAARYVGGRREMNHRSTTQYISQLQAGQSPVAEQEILAAEDRARERLVFGLRMLRGLTSDELLRDVGYSIASLAGDTVAGLVENQLLQWTDDRLRLTRRGLLVSDAIWPKLLAG